MWQTELNVLAKLTHKIWRIHLWLYVGIIKHVLTRARLCFCGNSNFRPWEIILISNKVNQVNAFFRCKKTTPRVCLLIFRTDVLKGTTVALNTVYFTLTSFFIICLHYLLDLKFVSFSFSCNFLVNINILCSSTPSPLKKQGGGIYLQKIFNLYHCKSSFGRLFCAFFSMYKSRIFACKFKWELMSVLFPLNKSKYLSYLIFLL